MSERLLTEEQIAALPAEPAPAESEWREITPEEYAARFSTPVSPDEAKWPHEWHTLCWLLASGLSQRDAAREMGYTESRISIICSQPGVAAKTERIKAEHYGNNIAKGVARVAPKALDYMEQVILGQEGSASVGNRLHAAQWVLEKHSGKPKQEIISDGSSSVLDLLKALQELRAQQEPSGEGRTVAALSAPQESDPVESWVSNFMEAGPAPGAGSSSNE